MSVEFHVRLVTWSEAEAALRAVRSEVFIAEQQVPEADEWDAEDFHYYHVLAVDTKGEPIGCGRLLPDGHIGRMAVRRPWRGKGVGAALLRCLLDEARRQGLTEVKLHAQTHAVSFYERFGFRAEGETFLEAGILHRRMGLPLSPSNG